MPQDEHQYEVRTDLAVEAKDMYVEKQTEDTSHIPGVDVKERTVEDINITDVTVNDSGEGKIGKKAGTYVTIYADGVKQQDTEKQKLAATVLAKELESLLHKNNIGDQAIGLIVGLGNWQITPDALGPMTIEKALVTHHLFILEHETVAEGYRSVASIAPGVMGTTGMETSDIIFGIVEKLRPDFIIAVDALASRSIERVNETIQLTDTGIHPGSGVGNSRKEISKETLGIPVIAIGVPTVVDAATITSDTIDLLLKHFGREWQEKDRPAKPLAPGGMNFGARRLTEEDLPDDEKKEAVLGMVGLLSEEEKRSLLAEVLTPTKQNLIVTPKEVDGFMLDMAHVLASGINGALHENIAPENLSDFTR